MDILSVKVIKILYYHRVRNINYVTIYYMKNYQMSGRSTKLLPELGTPRTNDLQDQSKIESAINNAHIQAHIVTNRVTRPLRHLLEKINLL